MTFPGDKKKTAQKIQELQDSNDVFTPNMKILKKAWNDLPADFTMGERSLFIELAERIIKLSGSETSTSN